MNISQNNPGTEQILGAVDIINYPLTRRGTSRGGHASAHLDVSTKKCNGAVLQISGSGEATFSIDFIVPNPPEGKKDKILATNTGIEFQLVMVDGKEETLLARNQSFEGEASGITFFSSAAKQLYLPPKKDVVIEARTVSIGGISDPPGSDPKFGGAEYNRNAVAELCVIALPVLELWNDK